MKLNPSAHFFLSFLCLVLFFHELHEVAHVATVRWFSGCWPHRDFINWHTCGHYSPETERLVLMAGPLVTYGLLWTGFVLLGQCKATHRSLGLCMVFASMPAARLAATAMGGGDEMIVIRSIIGNGPLTRVVGLLLVGGLCLPSVMRAIAVLGGRQQFVTIGLLLVVPFCVDRLLVEGGLNQLLLKGWLNRYWLPAEPALITVYTSIVLIILLWGRRFLQQAFVESHLIDPSGIK